MKGVRSLGECAAFRAQSLLVRDNAISSYAARKAGIQLLCHAFRGRVDPAESRYLAQRGLPVTPTHWQTDTPLLANLERSEGITTPRLREMLRRFFLLAAESIEAGHPAPASKLRRATPAQDAAHPRDACPTSHTTVREDLCHASSTTTSIDLHDDEVQRARVPGNSNRPSRADKCHARLVAQTLLTDDRTQPGLAGPTAG
uniref:Truncated putative phage integrase n=1 Tax=Alcaligenes sp. NyZ215 TaxID=441452 RepID=A7KS60_9BURK|nr:truncated putative phage integrase [Alcaligenes sp. NyZ215]